VSDMAQYTIGAEVTCSDGVCGDLVRVVIDPVARALTHLVVEPKYRQGQGRLVPIDLVDASAQEIRLRCSATDFDALDHAEETHFVPDTGEQMGYGAGQTLTWPYYGLDTGIGMGAGGMDIANIPLAIIDDRVPAGEVEVRRDEHVHATDGAIGRVQGLVIDPADHHVTHVLLEEGHFWGKKEIAIPIGAVIDVTDDGVRLNLTKYEVRDLPPVELAQHSG
jgi:PRC-barrel domain